MNLNQDYGIYVCADAAPDGISCLLEEENAISEEEIVDFIRLARPDLFKSLNKLPVASSDIPLTNHGLIHFRKMQSLGVNHGHTLPVSKSHFGVLLTLENIEVAALIEECSLPTIKQNRVEIKHKDHIQRRLLRGDILVLQKWRHPTQVHYCNHSHCFHFQRIIPINSLFVTLRDHKGLHGIRDQDDNYCIQCLEQLCGQPAVYPLRVFGSEAFPAIMDGATDDATNTTANEKMSAMRIKVKRNVPPAFTPYPLCSSNSTTARHVRQHRDEEIEETLRLVDNFEQQQAREIVMGTKKSLLTIKRPVNVGPFWNTYKKQGMTRYDQHKAGLKRESSSPTSLPSISSNEYDEVVQCSCLEGSSESDVIRCAADSCIVGFFHRQCYYPADTLISREPFFCRYCVDPAQNHVIGVAVVDNEAI